MSWNKGLAADYMIDYENGTILIGDLPIGIRVVDPTWVWEFRTGDNYTGSGKFKPVTWIVVAKDHYDLDESHVTLLSDELIGGYCAFDNSTSRGSEHGCNHWGNSGTANAVFGLRPWLNSIGIHSGEGFYQAFSDRFKKAVLATAVPNKEWEKETTYSTIDNVFIPSATELQGPASGSTKKSLLSVLSGALSSLRRISDDCVIDSFLPGMTVTPHPGHLIGSAYPYRFAVDNKHHTAQVNNVWFWTRTPALEYGSSWLYGYHNNMFCCHINHNCGYGGVLPVVNLKSGIIMSKIRT